jgi:hypothetical protein
MPFAQTFRGKESLSVKVDMNMRNAMECSLLKIGQRFYDEVDQNG